MGEGVERAVVNWATEKMKVEADGSMLATSDSGFIGIAQSSAESIMDPGVSDRGLH